MDADKTKTIKNATDEELRTLLVRLRNEKELQELIISLKRSSEENPNKSYDGYYEGIKVSTETPINELYHFGVPGMRWGVRKSIKKFGADRKAHFKRSLKQKYGHIKPETIAKGKKIVSTAVNAYALYTVAKFTAKYLKTSAAIIRG